MSRHSNGIKKIVRSVGTQAAMQPLGRSEDNRAGILHGEIQEIGGFGHRVGAMSDDNSCQLTIFGVHLVDSPGQLQPQLRSHFRTGDSNHFFHLKSDVFRKLRNVPYQLSPRNVLIIEKMSNGSTGRKDKNSWELLGPDNGTTEKRIQNDH